MNDLIRTLEQLKLLTDEEQEAIEMWVGAGFRSNLYYSGISDETIGPRRANDYSAGDWVEEKPFVDTTLARPEMIAAVRGLQLLDDNELSALREWLSQESRAGLLALGVTYDQIGPLRAVSDFASPARRQIFPEVDTAQFRILLSQALEKWPSMIQVPERSRVSSCDWSASQVGLGLKIIYATSRDDYMAVLHQAIADTIDKAARYLSVITLAELQPDAVKANFEARLDFSVRNIRSLSASAVSHLFKA